MFPAVVRLLPIKDLKALSFFLSAFFYRHAGPNGPEEVFFTGACFPKVVQARQILRRSGSGEPELQRWARGAFRYSPVRQGGRHTETALGNTLINF